MVVELGLVEQSHPLHIIDTEQLADLGLGHRLVRPERDHHIESGNMWLDVREQRIPQQRQRSGAGRVRHNQENSFSGHIRDRDILANPLTHFVVGENRSCGRHVKQCPGGRSAEEQLEKSATRVGPCQPAQNWQQHENQQTGNQV